MNRCESMRPIIDAYLDSELSPTSAASLEAHLSQCESCRRVLESRKRLSRAIKKAAPRVDAPVGLGAQYRSRHRSPIRRYGPWGLALAFAICGASTAWFLVPRPSATDRLVDDLIASHQVPDGATCERLDTSSPMKIEKWFQSRGVRFEPQVLDFAGAGFKLKGGKVSQSEGRKVVALVYDHAGMPIDVFVTPSAYADAIPVDKGGVHVRTWGSCGLNYWAVASADPSVLVDLRDQFPSRDR
ncbi:MAG: zf-HC2 domain-containing protein [Fimbriimonas sp.]|nr:zf-HC2 domain-containing protein [Fimbriimonas sp.]